MGKNIFNISQERLDILDQIEELEGEMTPELIEALKVNDDEKESKLQDYIGYYKQLISDSNLAKDEAARYTQISKTKENAAIRLKKVLLEFVQLFGDTTKSGGKQLKYMFANMYTGSTKALKLDDDFYNIEYTNFQTKLSPEEVDILVENANAERVKEFYANPIIDNARLKADIAAGVEVDGAEIITNTHLVIK